jgi:hypothetical protein
MDGRTQEPVARYLKQALGLDYVDTVTEPGPDRILAEGPVSLAESIRRRVLISVEKHGSRHVAIVAHHECAGNPVEKAAHLAHLRKAADTVRSWNLPVAVIGLWVNERWEAEPVRL